MASGTYLSTTTGTAQSSHSSTEIESTGSERGTVVSNLNKYPSTTYHTVKHSPMTAKSNLGLPSSVRLWVARHHSRSTCLRNTTWTRSTSHRWCLTSFRVEMNSTQHSTSKWKCTCATMQHWVTNCALSWLRIDSSLVNPFMALC